MSNDRSTFGRRARVALVVLVGMVMVVAYVSSVLVYRQSIDEKFVGAESLPADVSSVVLVPISVAGQQQTVEAELLLFPGSSYLEGDVLKEDFSVALTPTVENGDLLFPGGSVPVPQKVVLPAPGVIEKYPFDTYQLRANVKVEVGDTSVASPDLATVPSEFTAYFNAPGWAFSPIVEDDEYSNKDRVTGVVSRSGPTITIAVIFILLILAFGVLAGAIQVMVFRGRYHPAMATASWLTAALFALISLRNGLPGQPPLGSWMDILVYFWVIATVMIITVATVALILYRSSAVIRGQEEAKAKVADPVAAD